MKEQIFFHYMSYIVTEDSVWQVVNALAEKKHIHMKVLSCANVKIGQKLWVLAFFVGKEPPTNNTML